MGGGWRSFRALIRAWMCCTCKGSLTSATCSCMLSARGLAAQRLMGVNRCLHARRIDYPTCPVGTSITDAQQSAKAFYDRRIALPDHNGVGDCTNALQVFACATYFPKVRPQPLFGGSMHALTRRLASCCAVCQCEWNAVSYTTCHSTCENCTWFVWHCGSHLWHARSPQLCT